MANSIFTPFNKPSWQKQRKKLNPSDYCFWPATQWAQNTDYLKSFLIYLLFQFLSFFSFFEFVSVILSFLQPEICADSHQKLQWNEGEMTRLLILLMTLCALEKTTGWSWYMWWMGSRVSKIKESKEWLWKVYWCKVISNNKVVQCLTWSQAQSKLSLEGIRPVLTKNSKGWLRPTSVLPYLPWDIRYYQGTFYVYICKSPELVDSYHYVCDSWLSSTATSPG